MKDKNAQTFKELGSRYRKLRYKNHMVQEDVAEYGFSVRHYQQLEAGRSHSLRTLFRIADMFDVKPETLIKGLSLGKKRKRKSIRP